MDVPRIAGQSVVDSLKQRLEKVRSEVVSISTNIITKGTVKSMTVGFDEVG